MFDALQGNVAYHFAVTCTRRPVGLACRTVLHTDTMTLKWATTIRVNRLKLTCHYALASPEEQELCFLHPRGRVDLDLNHEVRSPDL